MSDFIFITHMIIPVISPPAGCPTALPGVFVRTSGRHPFLMGELKNEQRPGQQKSHCHARQRLFTIILVYSIVPYLRRKVQENRYFTGFPIVIHSIFRPVDNYCFSSWAGATAGAVAINL